MQDKNITEKVKEDKIIFQDWETVILEELNKKEQKEVNKNENKNS